MLNYNHLYYFYVVAAEGGMTRAARKLRVSQPALSAQIRLLEEHLGERPFSLGLVRELLGERAPRIRLVAGTHEGLAEKLRGDELDFLVSDRQGDLACLGGLEMPIVCVVSRERLGRRVARLPERGPALAAYFEEKGVGWLLPSGMLRLRGEIDRFFGRARGQVTIAVETDHMATLVRGALDGAGAAFLPLPYVAEWVGEGLLAAGLPGGLWRQPLRVLAAAERFPHPLAARLRAALDQRSGTRPPTPHRGASSVGAGHCMASRMSGWRPRMTPMR